MYKHILAEICGYCGIATKVQGFEEVTLCCWVSGLVLFECLQHV
jgi:hypothetical protein